MPTPRDPIEFTRDDPNRPNEGIWERCGNEISIEDSSLENLVNLMSLSNGGAYRVDAGGRLRVSQITTLGDYKHNFGINTLFMDSENINTGNHAYDDAIPGIAMTTTANGDGVVHQTKQWHNYQSGKSSLQEYTMSRFDLQTDIIKRFGYFSSNTVTPFDTDYDGFYVASDGQQSNFYHVILKDGAITESIERASWYDPLDGSGPSGINANFSNFNVFATDFLWLGGTEFSLYYKYDDAFYLANRYYHAGHKTSPAILSPSQPVRYEIRQVGAGSGVFNMICAVANTEGSINRLGVTSEIGTGANRVFANTPGVFYALAGYRIQADKRGTSTSEEKLSLIETSGANNDFVYEIRLNPTVATTGPAPFTWSDFPNSNLQYAIGDITNSPSQNTVTGGIKLAFGYGSEALPIFAPVNNALQAGSFINGTMDEVILCVSPLSNNQRIAGNMTVLSLV